MVGLPLGAREVRSLAEELQPPVGALLRPAEEPTWAQSRAGQLRSAHADARQAWYAEFERKHADARAKAAALRSGRQ